MQNTVAAIANATAVCEDGQPQKIPCWRNPKLNWWLTSTFERYVKNSGCILPVNALEVDEMRSAINSACASTALEPNRSGCLRHSAITYIPTGRIIGMKKPPIAAGSDFKKRMSALLYSKNIQSTPVVTRPNVRPIASACHKMLYL